MTPWYMAVALVAASITMTSPQLGNSLIRLRARLSTDSCHQREFEVSFHSSKARCEERAFVSESNPIQREFSFFISMYIPTKIKHRNQWVMF